MLLYFLYCFSFTGITKQCESQQRSCGSQSKASKLNCFLNLDDETLIKMIFYRKTSNCAKHLCQTQEKHFMYRSGNHRVEKRLPSHPLPIHVGFLRAYCVDAVPPSMADVVNCVGGTASVFEFDKRYEFTNGSLLLWHDGSQQAGTREGTGKGQELDRCPVEAAL